MRLTFAACLLLAPALVAGAAPKPTVKSTRAPAATRTQNDNITSGALIEALMAIDRPELTGVFTFVGERNSTFAFADLMARDLKALKRYTAKLAKDMNAANGTTAWDHEVCAALVNYYSGPGLAGLGRPDKKRLRILNQVVLSPVMTLQEIVVRRDK